MKKIQGYAAGFFVFAVSVLGVISVLGIWKFFESDVIIKSFQTLGLLAVVAVIVMLAGRFIDAKSTDTTIYVPNPGWTSLRKGVLVFLIVCVSILALLGVLSIWDVITDKDVLYRSLGTLAVLAFCSFIVVMTCLGMEHDPTLPEAQGVKKSGMSGGMIAVIIVGCLFLLPYLFSMFLGFGRW